MGTIDKLASFKSSLPVSNTEVFEGRGERKDTESANSELKPSEKFIKSLGDSGFVMDELADLVNVKGNQVIVSCAGAGKTTALLIKIQKDILTGELSEKREINGRLVNVLSPVLVCTFLRSGADDLKNSMRRLQVSFNLQKTYSSISFSTLHSEFFKVIRQLGFTNRVISEKNNRALLKDVLQSVGVTNKGKKLDSRLFDNLYSALSFSRSRLDGKRYEHEAYYECKLTPIDIDEIITLWRVSRQNNNFIDFGDMEEILYNFCYKDKNEDVIDLIASKYKFLYVDEFQDTSQMQYELLKVYASKAKKVVVIGDDDQCIYSWRGSDIDIITRRFIEDFKPTESKITMNFRCPENILNVVKPSISHNTQRVDKDLKAFKKGGTCEIFAYKDIADACEYAYRKVYEQLKNNKEVVILCRTNLDGLVPALYFESKGTFEFSVTSEGMTFDNYIGKLVMKLGKLFTTSKRSIIVSILDYLVDMYDKESKYKVDLLAKKCENLGITIFQLDAEDINYEFDLSSSKVGKFLIEVKDAIKYYGEVEAYIFMLEYFIHNVFARDNSFNDSAKMVINSVLSLMNIERFTSVSQVLSRVYELNSYLRSRLNAKARVKISTVHEFKGKECDNVIVWNDSDGVFPSRLSQNDAFDLEEERRVHYIACTRAKENEFIVYKEGNEGMFLKEMDLSNVMRGSL